MESTLVSHVEVYGWLWWYYTLHSALQCQDIPRLARLAISVAHFRLLYLALYGAIWLLAKMCRPYLTSKSFY